MPRCLKCGKVYHAKYITGYCNDCTMVAKPEPEPTSSSSHVSFEKYEEEVERVKAAQNAPRPKKKKSRQSSTVHFLAFCFVALLLIASLVTTLFAFGLTRHGVLWSLSILFFFLGSAAIVTKRLLGKRSANVEAADQIEPAVASAVGGLCLLPLGTCTFYYSMNSDMPPTHALWIVGIMLVVALAALIAGSVALSKAE